MLQTLIILPVAAQAFLTFAVLLIMGGLRHTGLRSQGKTIQDLSHPQESEWTLQAQVAARCFRNQFELPVLFYVVCTFILMTRTLDMTQFVLACVFVVARLVQVFEHLTNNRVAIRGGAYLVGFIALVAMWTLLLGELVSRGF